MSERALTRLLPCAAALTAFAPALLAGFAGWDDPVFIVENPAIRGLDWHHLRAMAASTLGGVWIPLTWLSLAADRALWALEPGGYHLTNLLLHALTTLLFHEVCLRLFSRLGLREPARAAVLAALFFAVHPLRVESVAWVAERKGVLAGALWTASLLAWLESLDSPRRRAWQAASLAAFALSLLAKPNGLTLPLALLVLEAALPRRRPSLVACAPYLALSAAAFGATMLAVQRAGGLHRSHPVSLAWAAGQALYGLTFYPLKTLWPSGLSVYYPPLGWFGSWSWPLAAHAAALAAVLAALRARGASARPVAAALACYALALLPMLGLVQHGVAHAAADRFSYLPGMALAALFGAAFAARGRAALALAALWLLALGAASWRRCAAWETPLTLWTAAARAQPGAYALANQGALLAREGRHAEALPPLKASLALAEGEPVPHEALGAALAGLGREEEARAAWREGLRAAPSPELQALLGASLAKGPALSEGIALLEEAVAARPERPSWRADLGGAYARAGRPADARRELQAVLAAEPRHGRALNDLGLLAAAQGRLDEARALYVRALASPDVRARASHNLGNLEMRRGLAARAERRFREAARLDPGLGAARVNLGNLLARRGLLREAAAQYRAVRKEDRASREARSNLAQVEALLPRTR